MDVNILQPNILRFQMDVSTLQLRSNCALPSPNKRTVTVTLWTGDIRNNKGEDCASNQDCASKESVWGGWHPSAEFSSHQQNNARYAYCCNTSKTRKTKILFLKVNLAQALQRSLLTPSMLVKVRWYQLPGSLQVLILLLFKVDVESLADFGNGGQVR